MTQTDIAVISLLVASAACYLAAWPLLTKRPTKPGIILMAAGWGISAALFVVNGLVAGEPPFGNMYHVQVVLALCFVPLYALLSKRDGLSWTAPYFAVAAALPLIGALFMERDVHWRRVPALQSPWFVPHVLAYMISYALAAIAVSLTIARLIRVKRQPDAGEAPEYRSATLETLRLAFPFMTFGMLSGALWAEEAWGVYWSWDAKETWSLVTWTLYLVYFHCRYSRPLQRYADLAQILAFLALLTTFFLVNLLPKLSSALHSYA
ncbi:MAG: cytochrome c biogenesis protein CcsA [Lentisphaerae bacterium]|jgi:ABC-type transport system involved in cytochrome c biogenesis permease subunit|nr:cytochrome c biogenesis protein CcsA [Lentisphaerota bacterium]MBT4814184.1 cytochrome c biogenesis protein CcsA [Lentisphaerota bacterium]MBT5605966.1 cytochrome c biogenesis protein CcsA [Lentisphaerota bacterium]MBT7060536.1 cytochrome c biogenesis protein CcsA [Lentisphaerota bacterium]MBT7847989.1 cytochrome c biogenesis protein CcsA [Lentisphaerota bacterium]